MSPEDGAFRRSKSLAVVAETMQPGVSISYVARRHGLSPSLVFRWRRLMSEGGKQAVRADEEVVPASDVRKLEERVRELERLLGRKTRIGELSVNAPHSNAVVKDYSDHFHCCPQRLEGISDRSFRLAYCADRPTFVRPVADCVLTQLRASRPLLNLWTSSIVPSGHSASTCQYSPSFRTTQNIGVRSVMFSSVLQA